MRDVKRIIKFADKLTHNDNAYIAALATALAEVARHAEELEHELNDVKRKLEMPVEGSSEFQVRI